MKAATKFSFTRFGSEFDLILLLQQIEQHNETFFIFWTYYVSLMVVLSKCKTLEKLYL